MQWFYRIIGKSPPKPEPSDDPDPEFSLDELLLEHVQKGYDREINDHDAIWRSLPLFAVLFGFAGAMLLFLATKAPTPTEGLRAYIVYALIVVCLMIFGNSVRYAAVLIWPRVHRYLPSDVEVQDYGHGLLDFHRQTGLDEVQANVAAQRDLRTYLIGQLAGASAQNRAINQKKGHARVQSLFYLFLGFLFSFLVAASILVDEKIIHPSEGNSSGSRTFQTS